MGTSILIAQILAVLYLVLGVGLLFNSAYYKKVYDALLKNTGVIFVFSIIALIGGLLIILFHNIWVAEWVVIVTIIGWIGFLKGVLLILLPKQMLSMTKSMLSSGLLVFSGIFALVLGLVLGYFGYQGCCAFL